MTTLAQRNRLRRGAGCIRIPRHFYYDHLRRSHFGAPTAWKGTKRHIWINPADAAFDALLKDARYHAGAGGSGFCKDEGYRPEHFGLRMSALATVKAIESFLNRIAPTLLHLADLASGSEEAREVCRTTRARQYINNFPHGDPSQWEAYEAEYARDFDAINNQEGA